MRIPAIMIVASGLAGCGVVAQFQAMDARHDYQGSVAAYKECLVAHAPNQCEGLRLAMEADERKVNTLMPGARGVANINVQNR